MQTKEKKVEMRSSRTDGKLLRTDRHRRRAHNGRIGVGVLAGISALALLGGSALAQVDDAPPPTPPTVDATATTALEIATTLTEVDTTTEPTSTTSTTAGDTAVPSPPPESSPAPGTDVPDSVVLPDGPSETTTPDVTTESSDTALAPPEGVTITVNGLPFPEGGSKIPSCVFQVDVKGLSTDEHQIRVLIEAVSPTVPEDSSQVVFDETVAASGPDWWNDITMDDLVAQFERKPNGYHLKLSIQIDGDVVGAHTYWLGCDEAQTGKPTRVQFAVQWVRIDGSDLISPYDPALPDGWREPFALDAESDRGTASCGYPDSSDELACEYDNPGHGSEKPGLVVPGNPRATYDVGLAGVPAGWELDESTVGTFVGRETCPRGGEHEEPQAAPSDHEPGHEEEPCFHVVVLNELVVPPTPTTPTTTATTAMVSPASSAQTATSVVAAATGTLPVTGSQTGPLLAIGLGLIGLGLAAIAGRRRLASPAD